MFTIEMDCLDGLRNTMEKLNPDGKTQLMFANELHSISEKYTPRNTGALIANSYVDKGGTAIVYNSPYARYLWYGKVMVDPDYQIGAFHSEDFGFWSRKYVNKEVSARDLQFKGAPLRGPRWVERAWIDNKEQLEQQLIDYITRFDTE